MRIRAFRIVLRNSFIAGMEYRAEYLILILATLITVFMETAVFRQIFADKDIVGGLPRELALPFVLMGALVGYSYQLWSFVGECIDEVRTGEFRKYLLQPIRYGAYFAAKAIGPKITTWAMALVTVMAVRWFPEFSGLLPPGTRLAFVGAWITSIILVWELYLLLVMTGFWIEEASFLATAFNVGLGLFAGRVLPLSWFPETLQTILSWTPLPLMGDLPIRSALGLLSSEEYITKMSQAWLWALGLWILNSFLKARAYQRYESYGS